MLRKSPYSLPASQYGGGRKRIFIGLMLASCCVACLALAFFLILPWSDYGQTLTWLPLLCMLVGGAGILALIWMCGTLVWHVYTGRYLPGVSSVRHVTIRLFFPLMELLAKVVRMERKRVRHSFIKVNNELVLADRPRVRPERLLLLLPHCIQRSACPHRLNHNVDLCRRCGQCPVGGLLQLRDRYGFHLGAGHRRDHRPAHRGPDAAPHDHRRGLRTGPHLRHPGQLPLAGLRHPQPASLRPLSGHAGVPCGRGGGRAPVPRA